MVANVEVNETSTQNSEIMALRSFYSDESPLTVVDMEDVIFFSEPAEVSISDQDSQEVCAWLRNPMVWAAFKPVAREDEQGRVMLVLK